MSGDESRVTDIEARLRRLMSGLDARPGFESRVQVRIAALAALPTDLRAQLEARRQAARRRLRREAWANGVTIAGVGAAAAVLVWRFVPEIEQAAGRVMAATDPVVIGAATLAAVAAAVLPLLRRLPGWS